MNPRSTNVATTRGIETLIPILASDESDVEEPVLELDVVMVGFLPGAEVVVMVDLKLAKASTERSELW
jgi:hypothetical protein